MSRVVSGRAVTTTDLRKAGIIKGDTKMSLYTCLNCGKETRSQSTPHLRCCKKPNWTLLRNKNKKP